MSSNKRFNLVTNFLREKFKNNHFIDVRHGGRHGYPRHAGDLGNIRVGHNSVMIFDLYVSLKGLEPYDGFIGRSLVIHANMDDLGRNADEGSRTTGNSGPRLACATIGYRAP
ncbi:unnamed protein product [Schistosoma curassoni]|uniref:Superoxide dismutase [Cu-Zn] n=1 Tax=Schistosoma curassoni TaxID=6186 RepID=A0A183K4G5_9TREM|nr:unnamed protein product [Schistosoma curassoni]